MAWLQTSFTSHQLLVDSNSNKKSTKSCAAIKSTDPDKSNTPLLHDTSHTPENEEPFTNWLKSSSSTEKKSTCNASKSSFLPQSFFDKSSSKAKSQASMNLSNNTKKPAENRGLLWEEDKKKNPLFEDDDDDPEEDSDDDWFIPRMGGYQKVRPSAE